MTPLRRWAVDDRPRRGGRARALALQHEHARRDRTALRVYEA